MVVRHNGRTDSKAVRTSVSPGAKNTHKQWEVLYAYTEGSYQPPHTQSHSTEEPCHYLCIFNLVIFIHFKFNSVSDERENITLYI